MAGETDPHHLAEQAVSHLRKKLPELEEALEGRIREHHRRLLRLDLAQWRFLDQLLEELDPAIDAELAVSVDGARRQLGSGLPGQQ